EIFDVFKNDRRKRLPFYFDKHSGTKKTVVDLGCGNGKAFKYLSPLFAKVVGFDISQKLLDQAKKLPYTNIELRCEDLTNEEILLPTADFVFSCNVVMFPKIEMNYAMFRNIYRTLKPTGSAVLVLPALESVLFSSWRLISVYASEGVSIDEIPIDEFDYFKAAKRNIVQGIIHIDNVPTKHYMESEIEVVFRNAGLKVTALEKLEYRWDTEMESPPNWLGKPYPWDWLVECRRK
ncbi:MAG: class I SAM-dependent methyltransferase, partial [Cyclobacteriaceae bacterium]|nr:class I SAM-dependent methyltransferase [Cyclobacteriaceae bacterium]